MIIDILSKVGIRVFGFAINLKHFKIVFAPEICSFSFSAPNGNFHCFLW